ncbi:MAG: hypothetical protein E7C36_05135, partial [Mixta calida]|nr:hypothetical protein [Mixta calida]
NAINCARSIKPDICEKCRNDVDHYLLFLAAVVFKRGISSGELPENSAPAFLLTWPFVYFRRRNPTTAARIIKF